jgi:predicted ester cyclase
MHSIIRYYPRYILPCQLCAAVFLFYAGCGDHTVSRDEQLKVKIRYATEAAWNHGVLAALDTLYAPDFIRHRPPFPDLKGLEAHKQRVQTVRSAFPDHQTIIKDILIDGDRAAVWYIWEGTHTGEGLPIPPTGRRVSVEGCDIYRIVNGMVTEEWDHENFLKLYQQLGYVIEPPANSMTPAKRG